MQLNDHLARSLTLGRQKLDMEIGILSHIVFDVYEVMAVSGGDKAIQVGQSFALNDTYCREVAVTKNVVSITEVEGVRGMQNHPLYSGLSIEAYLSAPVFVEEDFWGTLNFSSFQIRNNDFSEAEIDWIKESARTIGTFIEELPH